MKCSGLGSRQSEVQNLRHFSEKQLICEACSVNASSAPLTGNLGDLCWNSGEFRPELQLLLANAFLERVTMHRREVWMHDHSSHKQCYNYTALDQVADSMLLGFRLSDIPLFIINLFSAGSPSSFARWTRSSLLTGALACFLKITKVAPFEFVERFRKNPFLALLFSLFSSMIPASQPSSVSCSL